MPLDVVKVQISPGALLKPMWNLDPADIVNNRMMAARFSYQNAITDFQFIYGHGPPDLTVQIAEELNAFDVVTRQKMIMTTDAMQALISREAGK